MNKSAIAALCFVPVAIPASILWMRHHVPVALSYVSATEIMTSVKLSMGPATTDVGVPPYVISEEEIEGTFDLAPGDSFTVTTRLVDAAAGVQRAGSGGDDDDDDGHGRGRGRGRGRGHGHGHGDCDDEQVSRIRFRPSQFADIDAATPDEIIEAINSQLVNGEAYEDNGHLVIVGNRVGAQAVLEIAAQNGTPLDVLAVPPGPVAGAAPVELTLSIPAGDDPAFVFAGDRYRIVASASAGSSDVDGATVPLQTDAATAAFDALFAAGQLPGFQGNLDGNDDGRAFLSVDAVRAAFGATLPPQVFLTFLVYDENNQVEYVSNLFTVNLTQ